MVLFSSQFVAEIFFAFLVARTLLYSFSVLSAEIGLLQFQMKHASFPKSLVFVWYLRHFFQAIPFVHPWIVAFDVLKQTRYSRVERAAMVVLEFLMMGVQIGILFPIDLLGVPDPVNRWIQIHTYGELRQWFGQIEFSERVMRDLCEVDEENCPI